MPEANTGLSHWRDARASLWLASILLSSYEYYLCVSGREQELPVVRLKDGIGENCQSGDDMVSAF